MELEKHPTELMGHPMKNNINYFWTLVLLGIIILTPSLLRSEEMTATVPEQVYRLIAQISDIEALKCNIQESYRTERQILEVAFPSAQSRNYSTRLDCELVDRVFGYLANTPEHERFIKAYQSIVRKSNYREFCTGDLFAEYMKLLQSGQARLIGELERYLKNAHRLEINESIIGKVLPEAPPRTQPVTAPIPGTLRALN